MSASQLHFYNICVSHIWSPNQNT